MGIIKWREVAAYTLAGIAYTVVLLGVLFGGILLVNNLQAVGLPENMLYAVGSMVWLSLIAISIAICTYCHDKHVLPFMRRLVKA